jgi:hypothetical protein
MMLFQGVCVLTDLMPWAGENQLDYEMDRVWSMGGFKDPFANI